MIDEDVLSGRINQNKWPIWLIAIVAVATALGLALRIAAANGDLWLDEFMSIAIVQGIPLSQVVLGLPVDNNHILNSVWLWAIGDHPSPLLARLPAVVFGTMCVPFAASIGARRNAFAGAVAAVLVACDGMLVHFTSEARGYAGLILATFAALDALEGYMDNPSHKRRLVAYGIAIGFGTFSQYTMVASSGALVAAAAIYVLCDHGATQRAWSFFRPVLDATVRGSLAPFACLMASMYFGLPKVGVKTPFSFETIVDGMGRMTSATLGAPIGWNDAVLVLATLLAIVAIIATPARRRGFPLAAIFALTAMRVLLHVPNENGARFHLTVAIGLVVLAVEVAARASDAGQRSRIAAVCATILLSVGGVGYDLSLAAGGRGGFSAPIALMSANGTANVAISAPNLVMETSQAIGYYDRKGQLKTVQGCGENPRWLLVVQDTGETIVDTKVTPPLKYCGGHVYANKGAWRSLGLSGYTWIVYERARTEASPSLASDL